MSTILKISNQIFSCRIISRLFSQIFYLLLIYCFATTKIYAQSDLRDDSDFFNSQVKEFGIWLDKTNISRVAHIDHLEIYPSSLSLILESNYKTDDSLKAAWQSLQNQYDKTQISQIGERIFNTFVFLCDIGPDSVTIFIKGKKFKDSGIKIFYRDYVKVDENFSQTLAGGITEIDLKNIKIEHNKKVNNVSSGVSVSKVRKSINDFLFDYYSAKNGRWHTINVDTSRNFINKSTYLITCIKNEIISAGYFEFIQIKIQVYQKGDQIQLSYDILGKYATGIRCPKQKEGFYKSMETSFQGKVEQYAEEMMDRITTHLSGGS